MPGPDVLVAELGALCSSRTTHFGRLPAMVQAQRAEPYEGFVIKYMGGFFFNDG